MKKLFKATMSIEIDVVAFAESEAEAQALFKQHAFKDIRPEDMHFSSTKTITTKADIPWSWSNSIPWGAKQPIETLLPK